MFKCGADCQCRRRVVVSSVFCLSASVTVVRPSRSWCHCRHWREWIRRRSCRRCCRFIFTSCCYRCLCRRRRRCRLEIIIVVIIFMSSSMPSMPSKALKSVNYNAGNRGGAELETVCRCVVSILCRRLASSSSSSPINVGIGQAAAARKGLLAAIYCPSSVAELKTDCCRSL